jgi:hypothetical protein
MGGHASDLRAVTIATDLAAHHSEV